MKLSTTILATIAFVAPCSSFMVPRQQMPSTFGTTSTMLKAVELHAEPEGGEEMVQIDTMAGSRMKNMGANDEVKGGDGATVYNFWLQAEVDGSLVKELRTQVMKDAAKNANFPGFRKGQIPPYAQPKMTMFAIQESVIKTCEAAVSAYGLKSLAGSDGEVNVNEDMQEVCNSYKNGENIPFTATLKAELDPEKTPPATEDEGEEAAEDANAEAFEEL
uniref:Trigger factor ribosome-binding bacterial domain-containing protein n=1 Tax=Helicotheca tamesis TaxID=374047 RepID=A0A7S2DYV0_9STRA|mmetsp:Transcript_10455/g.14642  ORF Transcript_10455/g.14642 Transcript_10455/m.14642 type:complete len:218 (+) Transcript_10455:80-733(+)|eukprot:CAMPEP_0185727322 /NCGR_PEP_ID=MMETSP1171-20130828/3036_1 /TAXON_ID=374046 /ORGANISM="Helicotheca tamensis, Strain CCMP826" /LENGTH=217 /DNA_ID=CAMNT_0028395857 /DNA_START=61 /DNA_END=714 /DNA_ORIENTATION=-